MNLPNLTPANPAKRLAHLCYHLLFSFRICRAESKIPLGKQHSDGI